MLKPQPRVTPLSRPFWDGCNDDRLMLQRCRSCLLAVFYPRVCCPHCHGPDLDWFRAEGRGSVLSHTTVRRTHHDGFNAEAPYVFAAIRLKEGPLFYAQLIDAPVDGLSLIGRPVLAAFVEHGPGRKLCAFRLQPL
ncbi:hypothetical protein BH09PSE6_BH09PSE6_12670 [soil metagenome]